MSDAERSRPPGNTVNKRAFTVTDAMFFRIAWPITLAYLTTPLLGLVDTAVVGRLGDAVLLGGLAVGAVLFDLLLGSFNFLRASTSGLVAQAMGAQSQMEEQNVLLRSLLIAIAAGMAIVVLAVPIFDLAIWAMRPGGEVAAAAHTYFHIRILATPVALANYAILGWLVGLGRTGLGLAIQSILNCVNIGFSIWLGLWLGWGIEGVAIATIIGEAAGLAAGLCAMALLFERKRLPTAARLFNREKFARLFAVNRDILIRSFCLIFAFAFFTAQGSRYGEVTLAANAILLHFFIVGGYFLDGLATAAEQLVGRSLGARHRPAFDRAVVLSMKWGLILALGFTAVTWIAGPWLIDLMTTNEAVRAEARLYMMWAVFTALAGVAAFQMDGVFIGATWSTDMRNMMLLSVLAYLAVWWPASWAFGNHGLWLALEVFLGVRGITLWRRMRIRANEAFGPA